jgi:RNA polymerase-binding transcription factor DksA
MSNRLAHITLHCHECDHRGKIDYEVLVGKFGTSDKLNLSNINTLLDRLKCKECQEKNFNLLDANDELLFDMQCNVLCEGCNLAISFPRLSIAPGTRVCVLCKDDQENRQQQGAVFPSVPASRRGKCPRCDKKNRTGIVVVYRNSKDRNYFLGCSSFPKCHWSSGDHWEELNK